MSTTIPKVTSPVRQLNTSIPAWLAKTKGKWISWGLIALVFVYVGFLILAPLVALAFGAFEQGLGAILEAFNDPFVLTSFWNTLWISLVVVVFPLVPVTATMGMRAVDPGG